MSNQIFKRILIILTTATLIFIASTYFLQQSAIRNRILDAVPNPDATLFDFNTELSKLHYKVNQYQVTEEASADLAKAELWAGLFAFKKTGQDEAYTYYGNTQAQLAVSLTTDHFIYESKPRAATQATGFITADEATERALQFIKDKALAADYASAEVTFENHTYHIRFINTLNGLKNYAYPKTVTVDRHGNILKMIYYDRTYEKVKTVSTCSAQDAAQMLKQRNFEISEMVDIKSCELVYYETNGKISPSYRFEGEMDGGVSVEFFVPAENKS